MSGIRRNLVSLLLSQAATQIATLVALIIVPRYVGASSYGDLAFAITFVGFFGLVARLGSQPYLVKEIARRPEELGRYVVNAIVMKLLLGTVLALMAVGLAWELRYRSQALLVIAACAGGIILWPLYDIMAAALQAAGRMGRMALWTAVQQYASGGIGVGLVLLNRGVVSYAVAVSLGPLVSLAANGRHLWPELRGHLHLDLSIWGDVARGGLPFAIWNAILLVYGSIDILMLEQMVGSRTVGWYNLAYTWVGLPVFIPTILTVAVFPRLSTSALAKSSQFSQTVNKALRLVVLAGTPMAVGIGLVAGDIISFFHYPADFAHAVPLIRILAFHVPVVGVDMILGTALAAKDRQKVWLAVGAIAAVFNPVLNLVAIPWSTRVYSNGAIGASVVTVLTEVLMMVGAIYIRPAGVLDRSTLSFIGRSIAASAAMIPPVLLIAGAPLAAKIALGVAVFITASFAVRLVSIRTCRTGVVEARQLLRRDRAGVGIRRQASGVPEQ